MLDMDAATIHDLPQVDPVTFMASADMNKSTYYNRLRGRNGWTAAEVKRAADALGVDVSTLFNGLALPGSVPSEGVTRKYPDEGAVIIPFPLPLAA